MKEIFSKKKLTEYQQKNIAKRCCEAASGGNRSGSSVVSSSAMFQIHGAFASASVYSNTADQYAQAQIKMICDNEVSKGTKIAIMSDVHPGKAGPIGFTQTVGNKIMPALVGVDIGCGVSYIKIREKNIEYERLDKIIRENILVGSNHFLEFDRDDEGDVYVVVLSGSRSFGKDMAELYMKKVQKALKKKGADVPYELTYLEGGLMEDYLHDFR